MDVSLANTMAAANNSFFSLTEEDDAVLSGSNSPNKTSFSQVDLSQPFDNSSPMHRSRRLSSGSMTTEAANLFPIYESPQQVFRDKYFS